MNNVRSGSLILTDDQIKEQLKKLVIARLMAVPEDLRLSIGNTEYDREGSIDHVRKGDTIGVHIMDVQLAYLRDLATGKIYENEKNNPSN